MDKIIKYKVSLLVLIFSLFLLFIPDQVHGLVLDLAKKQIEALSGLFGFTVTIVIGSFIIYLIGYFYLWIMTALLQGIIIATPTALTVIGDSSVAGLVRQGWELSAGIVNLILIIAFIVIAFAVILGSEKIQLKKAFPRLIMVALLVNFTLLFVGIGIDVSNFLFNTIAEQFMAGGKGGNILFNAILPLFDWGAEQILRMTAFIVAKVAAMLVPYASTIVQVAFVGGTSFIYSIVFQFIFYGVIMWVLAGIFFVFYVIFLARIFIIQILAMLAPLAFFCLIFDDTKKWWTKWLETLLQWLLVGVIFIFLMYFALAFAPLVQSLGAQFELPLIIQWFTGDVVSHIVLLIYFLVVIGVAKKFVPAAVNVLISQAHVLARTAIPFAGALATGTGQYVRNAELKKAGKAKEGGDAKEGGAVGNKPQAHNFLSWVVRRGYNMAGTSVEQENKKDIESTVKTLKEKHGDSYKDFIENLRLSPLKTEISNIATLQYLSEGGAKGLGELDSETLYKLIESAGRAGHSKTVINAVRNIADRFDVPDREEKLVEAKEKVKEANPLLEKDALDSVFNKNEEVIKAQKNLDTAKKAAEIIEEVMMSDINKTDPNINALEQKLEDAKKAWKEADDNRDDVLKETSKKSIKEIEKDIQKAKTAAIYKISVRSLKPADIENLSSDTLKSEGFLRAIVENRNMKFIQSILDRNDAPEVIKDLIKTISNMDIDEFKKLNLTLYKQIKKNIAGQGIFGEINWKKPIT